MLGRNANDIYWMFRYLERAENTSRLLEAGLRLAITRGTIAAHDEWRSVLVTIGQDQDFRSRHAHYSAPAAINYMLSELDNPASVLNMIEQARMNARSVRTGLSREVWEAINESWMRLRQVLEQPVTERNLGEILSTIRAQATQVRGAMDGSMLRNEVFNFARLGTFIERADNTLRILDVKYYVLLPSVGHVGSTLDNAQWETVLRSLAGDRAYRWLHAGVMDPRGIAEFLILDSRFPRSLAFCYGKLNSNLSSLTREYGREGPAHQLLRDTDSQLKRTSIDRILELGLHEFIGAGIADVRRIAEAISNEFRFVS